MIDQIRDLISQSKLTQIFDLKIDFDDRAKENEFILLKGRYTKNESDNRLGVSSPADYSRERTRIGQALLEIFNLKEIMNKNIVMPGSVIKTKGDLHIGDMVYGNGAPAPNHQSNKVNEFTLKDDLKIYFFDPLKTLLLKKHREEIQGIELNVLMQELYRYMAHAECIDAGINCGIDAETLQAAVKKFYTTTCILLGKRVLNNPEKLYATLLDALTHKNRRAIHDLYLIIYEEYNIENPTFMGDEEVALWGERITEIIKENMI